MVKRIVTATLIGLTLGGSALSAKTIATVNGYPITQKEADAFVKKVTKGRATYSMLKKEDRKRVIKELATNKLLTRTAAKELTKKEKRAIWTDVYIRKHYKELMKKAEKELTVPEKYMADAELWIRKKSRDINVTEEEMKAEYEKRKKLFKNPKTGKITPYEKVRPLIYMELKKMKFVKQVMKNAKIDYNPKPKSTKKSNKNSDDKKK
jgi:vancomycin resistance protein YoaR